MNKIVRRKIVPKRMFYDIGNRKTKRICSFYNCIWVYLFLCDTVNSLSCYQCIGTHPGCTLYNMDWIYQKVITCPRIDDRCVKVKKQIRYLNKRKLNNLLSVNHMAKFLFSTTYYSSLNAKAQM